MGHPDAAAILRTLAEKRSHELEAVYRSILLDALTLPEDQRLWWEDLTSLTTCADAFTEVEVQCWRAAVEAMWLDLSLEHGFPAPPPDTEGGA